MCRPKILFQEATIAIRWMMVVILGLFISCRSTNKKARSETGTVSDTDAKVTVLFNGKDLSGWDTYLRPPEPTSKVKGLKKEDGKYIGPIGLNKDPLNVFTVVEEDGAPAIRISGEVFGALTTEQEYGDYHFSVEFKWGKQKFPPRETQKRDSGVLYHCVGENGVAGGSWMRSVESQVQEGDVGDLWCVDSTTAKVKTIQLDNKKYRYDKTGESKSVDMRTDRYCQKSADFEKRNGDWNRLDIYVHNRESVHVVNGKKNMHLTEIGQFVNGEIVALTKGKIQIQSEGAEIFYRDINIRPINKMPMIE